MKISVAFEFNCTNSSSVDTNLERSRQPGHLQILSKILIKEAFQLDTWQFKERLKERKKENIFMAAEKMRKGKIEQVLI